MHRKWFAMVVVGIAGFLACSHRMMGQQSPANGVPVRMVVTAEAHKGSELPAINREDVMVMEGHDRDTVVDWVPATGEHAAMELFVLLDDGADISLGSQLDEIKKFILAQPESTKIGVAYMQNGTARVATVDK